MRRRTSAALAGALALAAAAMPGDARAGWDSRWRAEPLGEDGSVSSWANIETKSDAGIEIGAVNDGENLWVRLLPKDFRAQMGLMAGVTVWFGEEDSADRFGIRIVPERPDGPPEGDRVQDRERDGDRARDRDRRRDSSGPDPQEMGQRVRDALKSIDVLSADGMTERAIAVPAEKGVDVRVETTDVVSWVLRVPLAGSGAQPAVGAGPGDEVRIAVEGESPRRPDGGRSGPPPGGRGLPGGGGPGGSPRGGGGPGGGPGFGRGGPPGGGPPEPVDFHAKLKLAKLR